MVYLDYSATTPINDEVLDTYVKVSKEYIGNANSLHSLGCKSAKIIELATNQIKEVLNVKNHEVIYTSGASESNNLVIKGIASKYENRGNRIITTPLEHSSIVAPLNYLSNNGFIIDIVKVDENGLVDLEDLEKLLADDVILVTVSAVNSEMGIKQNLDEIKDIIKKYPKCFFHVDATQAIGKIKIDLNNIDFISFSAHKFYGPCGIGALLKKDNIIIDNLVHGGLSTTKYRSGTPQTALIVSMAKALRLAYQEIDKKYEYIQKLNTKIMREILNKKDIHVNSTNNSIPHILNFSIKNIKPETMLHALEKYDIYISTKSACSSKNSISTSVYAVYKNESYASTSLRISLSHLTTLEEIEYFIEKFNECYNNLNFKED